jgi:hypothetical protein
MSPPKPQWSRREFIRVAGILGGALALAKLPACGGDDDSAALDDGVLPSLGGAPDTHEGQTIAAFCDTVVPGKHRDPKKAPGAIDAGAPAMFFDPELPAAPYVGLLVTALDVFARQEAGSGFASISIAARERTLEKAVKSLDILEFAIQLAKLAFYASPEAAAYLGYPGPNSGYLSSPDFSFDRPMSREITTDGNYD